MNFPTFPLKNSTLWAYILISLLSHLDPELNLYTLAILISSLHQGCPSLTLRSTLISLCQPQGKGIISTFTNECTEVYSLPK